MSDNNDTKRGYADWPRWLRWSLELSGFVLVFLLVQQWQTRDMLPVDPQQTAPPLYGMLLDGGEMDVSSLRGRPTLVYFFAPWCKVCAFSASSLQGLRDSYDEGELGMVMVALSYDTVDAVREFRDEHELTIPVLLGNPTHLSELEYLRLPHLLCAGQPGTCGQSRLWCQHHPGPALQDIPRRSELSKTREIKV